MVGPIDAVRGHPSEGQTHARAPARASPRRAWAWWRTRPPRGCRLRRGAPVRGPALGQVERPIDQRPAVAAGIGQEHADLAVLDPPRRAAVLPLHAGRLAPFLTKPVSSSTSTPRIAQMLDHIGPQIVAHRVRVPAHPAQELLHPVRRPIPGRLRQLPALLALHRRQQPLQIGRRPPPRLDPPEPRPQPRQQRRELRRPRRAVIHRRHGFLLHGEQPSTESPAVVLALRG